jgi:chemotaxis protein MotA
MIVVVGCIVVLGAVVTGFTLAGGHLGALIQISEFVTIGGSALGAMIVMSPKKVLVDLARGLVKCVKGSPFGKGAYEDLLKALYDTFRVARRDGLIALETHLSEPDNSTIFSKYPRFAKNHHALQFLCNALSPVLEGAVKPEQLPPLLEADIKLTEAEHHAPQGVLAKTADALPGFGIVAAVLGIVITMSAINGPPEEIGEKVGAALVGTFLGILMSYGFLAPLCVRMEFLGEAEMSYLRTIATAVQGFVTEMPPKVVLEQARRGIAGEFRPSRQQMDEWFKQVEAA